MSRPKEVNGKRLASQQIKATAMARRTYEALLGRKPTAAEIDALNAAADRCARDKLPGEDKLADALEIDQNLRAALAKVVG